MTSSELTTIARQLRRDIMKMLMISKSGQNEFDFEYSSSRE